MAMAAPFVQDPGSGQSGVLPSLLQREIFRIARRIWRRRREEYFRRKRAWDELVNEGCRVARRAAGEEGY